MKKLFLLLILFNSANAVAGTEGIPPAKPLLWHFYATAGYVNYKDMVDSNVAIERIAGSCDFLSYGNSSFGIEVGVQTALNSRLLTTQEKIDILGGPAIQATIGTFFDVLGTLSGPVALPVLDTEHTEAFAKIGVAYRRLHFDRDTIGVKVNIDPEIQVGLSKSLTPHASIAIAYQGIYGKGVGLTVNGTSPINSTASVNGVPTQNGGLLIFSWNTA